MNIIAQHRIEIIEQPAQNASRFRYQCEGRSAGSIPGEHSTPDHRTYPTVRVVGYEGNDDIVITVSCVTANEPYRTHPHKLVGKDCKDNGVCSIILDKNSKTAAFTNLGIQCVKRKDMGDALMLQKSKRIDPYKQGFGHINDLSSIDLNCVRLCFQAVIKSTRERIGIAVSNPVYDKKATSELSIVRWSHSSGTVKGGMEMMLFCEKVNNKDDIQVRFYEENSGHVVWENYANKIYIHKQVGIAFETPAYHNQEICDKVAVFVQLYRSKDNATSEPKKFYYTGLETLNRWGEIDLDSYLNCFSHASHQNPIFQFPAVSTVRSDQNQNRHISYYIPQQSTASPCATYHNMMTHSPSLTAVRSDQELISAPTLLQQTTLLRSFHQDATYSSAVTPVRSDREQTVSKPAGVGLWGTQYQTITGADYTNTATFARGTPTPTISPVYTNLSPATSTQPMNPSINSAQEVVMRGVVQMYHQGSFKTSIAESNNDEEQLSGNLKSMSIESLPNKTALMSF